MTAPSHCQTCPARALAICGQISAGSQADLARHMLRMRIPEGRVLYGTADRSKSFTIITSGVVKVINSRPDGRQQIVSLQFPSDFVGRPHAEPCSLIAEAATDLEACSLSGRAFEDLLVAHRDLEHALLMRALHDLDVARDWMFLLGRKSAEEKVASFLAMISERMTATAMAETGTDTSAAFMRLPLSRSEIAECLSLRLETVSRQFANLKARGIIETAGRRSFRVHDMAALKSFSDATPRAA